MKKIIKDFYFKILKKKEKSFYKKKKVINFIVLKKGVSLFKLFDFQKLVAIKVYSSKKDILNCKLIFQKNLSVIFGNFFIYNIEKYIKWKQPLYNERKISILN